MTKRKALAFQNLFKWWMLKQPPLKNKAIFNKSSKDTESKTLRSFI